MMPATFLVNTTADNGPGSLRQAIIDSNDTPGSNIIDFGIGTGAETIALATGLPSITVPVLIDGTSQPNYAAAPLIDVNASNPNVNLAFDLAAGSDGSTIRGLVINGFSGGVSGIRIDSTDNVVQSCYVGTNAAGNGDSGQGDDIYIDSSGNTIGGTGANEGNLLSGTGNGTGVEILGAGATGNLIEGNRIGTSAAGNSKLGNADGVGIDSGASDNTIGGTVDGARNVISGNSFAGVEIDSPSTGNLVEGNLIGTDITGTLALGNGAYDVYVDEGAGNTIGGLTSTAGTGAGNVISGATDDGVFILDVTGAGNLVAGNLIGTNAAGTAALANPEGVVVDGGTANNTIGGTTAGVSNVISGDYLIGILLTSTSGNFVQGNLVGTDITGTLAVHDGTGVEVSNATANTIGGTDSGARNLISGNTTYGVEINGTGASGNLVAGDFIGTDITGTLSLPNDHGVEIDNGATANTIGGTTAGAGNLISGNNLEGVIVTGASDNLIEGNLVGTDVTGTLAVGNGTNGVELQGSSNDTVGGTSTAARNVISGNGQFNVYLIGASDETIQGNYVGTDLTGSFAVNTNTFSGIDILSSSGNLIGGTAPGAGNVISGNAFSGVTVGDVDFVNPATTIGNILEGNLIGLNAAGTAAVPNDGTGIDIGPSEDTQFGGTAHGRRQRCLRYARRKHPRWS